MGGALGVEFATSLLMPSTPPASAPADEFAALENMLPDFLERYSAGKVNNFLLGRCGPTIQRPLPAVPAGPDQMPWTFGGDADDAFELIRVKHFEPVVNLTGLQVNRLKACTSGQLIKLCSLAGISPMPDECISSPQLFASAIKHPRRKEEKEKEKRREKKSVRERKQSRLNVSVAFELRNPVQTTETHSSTLTGCRPRRRRGFRPRRGHQLRNKRV